MTWENVVLSAGVSAFVGAVVSILAVSRLTVGRLRAERTESAKRELLAAVRPLQLDLRRYEAGHKDMSRDPGVFHSDDLLLAARVLDAARDLPRPRRWLVIRRCRRIFGHDCTEIASLYESENAALEGSAWIIPLFASRVAKGEPARTFLDGLWHRALSAGPKSALFRAVSRELAHLAAAR